MKILVLGGGVSPEREISLRSAKNVVRALKKVGNEIIFYDPKEGTGQIIPLAKKADIVLPTLHGKFGEDGTIQKLLEEHRIKYLGSRPKSLSTTFDKFIFKQICLRNNIKVPAGIVVDQQGLHKSSLIKKPFVLKPLKNGSAIDVFIQRRLPKDFKLIDKTIRKYGSMLLEELVSGQEITVAILDKKALPVVEINPPKGEEFDFKNRYNGHSLELCPPVSVSKNLQKKAQEIAIKVHQIFGCRHFSRVDMIVSDNEIYVLEINSIPGLTKNSLYPKAAEAVGLSFDGLVKKLISLAK